MPARKTHEFHQRLPQVGLNCPLSSASILRRSSFLGTRYTQTHMTPLGHFLNQHALRSCESILVPNSVVCPTSSTVEPPSEATHEITYTAATSEKSASGNRTHTNGYLPIVRLVTIFDTSSRVVFPE